MPDTAALAVRRADALETIAGVIEDYGSPERGERIAEWRGTPGGIPATIKSWEIDATTPELLAALAEIVAGQQARIAELEKKLADPASQDLRSTAGDQPKAAARRKASTKATAVEKKS